MIWTFAFRNIFRNRERTLLTLSAVVFGTAAMILAGGFVDDALVQLREGYVRGLTGHLQLCRKGFSSDGATRPFDYLLSDFGGLSRALESSPYVRGYTGRLSFSGLLIAGDSTVSFVGVGVDPRKEQEISSLIRLDSGKELSDAAPYGIVAGRGLAKALRLTPGTPLMLLANSKSGALNALDVSVSGIFSTAAGDFDDHTIMLPLKTAQQLLMVKAIDTVAVLLDRTESTDAAMNAVMADARKTGLELEAHPWYELADFAVKAGPFLTQFFWVFRVILTAMVALGIFNTMNVAVMERTGEIGTMLALGTPRSGVIGLFLAEGLILGLLGGSLGVAVAYLLAPAINAIGVPMPPPPGINLEWVARINIVPSFALSSLFLSAAAAAGSALYPAVKASKKEIAAAMRENVL